MTPLRALAVPVLLLAAAFAGSARAAVDDLSSFGRLPVQEGGRVMPMDTFARLRLLQLSGRSTYGGEPAVAWLARTLFDEQATRTNRIFLVNNPEVVEALGLKPDGRRYSFDALHPGVDKLAEMAEAAREHRDEDRSPVEKEILRLYHNLVAYSQLMAAFRFAFPHEDFAVTNDAVRVRFGLAPGDGPFSFLDLYERGPSFAAEVQQAATNSPSAWTAEQATLFGLSSALYQWNQYHGGLPIPMLPLSAHGREEWLSPWDLMGAGFLDEVSRRELGRLQDLARAYRAGSQVEFDLAAHALERSVLARAERTRSLRHLDIELLYNRVDPFYRAQILYGLSFLLCLAAMMGSGRFLGRAALAGTLLALVPHTVGILWRMMVMGRPPMTNLYATFLFVAWICVVLGLAVEWVQRRSLGTFLASAGGLVLLMISNRFETQGDTLGVVVAVLDSNFWLSTHVVTITMGYAGCLAAGLAGHVYLLQALRRPAGGAALEATSRAVYGLLAFGLIFSFLGTMLGGVWADQSWGRFWGWDPKENGALLIVLWCALLFHARIGRMIGPVGMAAGSVLGVIVVLMAWIGINLLGVGLHSYGFTSGLARGLALSIAIEVLFVAATVPLILARRRAAPPPA